MGAQEITDGVQELSRVWTQMSDIQLEDLADLYPTLFNTLCKLVREYEGD